MTVLLRTLLIAIAAFLATATAAAAQTAYAGGSPITLSVPVTASVGGRCGFTDTGAPSGSYNQDNFDTQGLSKDFAFVLNCTGASRVAIVSANGALVNSGASVPGGYTNRAPYSVSLKVVANDGTSAQATCAASTLTAGSTCSFVGAASTSTGLHLASASTNQTGSYLRVSAPAYTGTDVLATGLYSDTLTVTVSPSL